MIGPREAALTRPVLPIRVDSATGIAVPGPFQRAGELAGDLLTMAGIVLCIPFVILAIGTPIALCVRLLLWIGERL